MTVLIRNAQVFDGENEQLQQGMDVLVDGERIAKVGSSVHAPSGATVLDADGRTLMPGLIDAHYHSMFNFWPVSKTLSSDLGLLSIAAAKGARETLLRGFTSVRDVGGNCFPVSQATDLGMIDGPRVYPSGGFICQSSGHADFRGPLDVPTEPGRSLDYFQRVGHALIADGVPEVIKRTREVLRMGATQVKAMAGGGVTSLYDPLDVTEYTFEEMKAIVEVAASWNTYVAIHVNTDAAIRLWLEAGARSVEHGFFMQDETAKAMAERGAWWSMQPLMDDEDRIIFENPVSQAKYTECVSGLDHAVECAKRHKLKIAFGCDLLFDGEMTKKQGKFLAKMQRWFTPFEALNMATSTNAELLKLCGKRDPYPHALGVVRAGAYADLLVVEGNPLEDIDLVADPGRNFAVIMKNGNIYKNQLS